MDDVGRSTPNVITKTTAVRYENTFKTWGTGPWRAANHPPNPWKIDSGKRISMLEITKPRLQVQMPPETLSALAIEAKSDPEAFGRLYDHYVQPVYRYIRSRVPGVYEAEDLTSQTFIAALENIHNYRERGYFSAWLFRIARSKLMDHYRGSRVEVPLEMIENHSETDDVLGRLARTDALKKVNRLIQALPEDERELIRLRYVANLSFAEMAEVLGKREDAVKKALYRLLAGIKSQVE
jgi:RNA polymerase sigma-70 factor (ECF subfamily)